MIGASWKWHYKKVEYRRWTSFFVWHHTDRKFCLLNLRNRCFIRVTLNCKEVVAKGACTLYTITRSITKRVIDSVQSYQIMIKNVPIIYKIIELDFLIIGRNIILSLQRRCQPLIKSFFSRMLSIMKLSYWDVDALPSAIAVCLKNYGDISQSHGFLLLELL